MKKKISILGCTGSIGDTVFKLIRTKQREYEFYILSGYKNYKKIIYLAKKFKPVYFIIFDSKTFFKVKKKLKHSKVNILNSEDFQKKKFLKSNISVTAIPGIAGLKPTIKIIKFSDKILIANKESVICGWDLIKNVAKRFKVKIFPLDSEHFSIMNLLKSINKNDIDKIYLTASGGPFLNYSLDKIKKVKPEQAINHPKWKMGKKISVDSATLMNKIFEIIEASKLFSIELKKIDILIHPQSLVHAVVKLKNGLTKLLYFETDMIIPIGNTLFGKNFNINSISKLLKNKKIENNLNFYDVDKKKFPAIKLKPILNNYASLPIIINAANEIFVDQFLKKKIRFCSIINYLFYLLKDPKLKKYAIKKPTKLKTIFVIDEWTRNKAMDILKKKK